MVAPVRNTNTTETRRSKAYSIAAFIAVIACLAFIYTVSGALLGIPWTWAARGDVRILLTAITWSPVVVIVLFIWGWLWHSSYKNSRSNGQRGWEELLIAALPFIWFGSPVICNAASLLAHAAGWNDVAAFLFKYRFKAFIAFLPAVVALGILRLLISFAWEYLSEKMLPSNSTPF